MTTKKELIAQAKELYKNGECYNTFDSDKFFRRETGLGRHIKRFDEQAYNRYYE